MRFTFSGCALDSESREIFRDGKPITLPPKAFQLLEILVRNRPKAVSKSQIHAELWPGTFVSDANLANLVAHIRAVLGDDARRPRIIRTVQRFGYAFAARVDELPSSPAGNTEPAIFRLIWGDREIALRPGENVLGREPEAAAWIDVHSVSRRHARIVVSGDSATLEDLGSKNGTFLGEKSVTAPRPLNDGDHLRIGTVEMVLRRFVGGISTESVRSR
jgi:DNA-binding winged helix-turn-helix (wHTH) protein